MYKNYVFFADDLSNIKMEMEDKITPNTVPDFLFFIVQLSIQFDWFRYYS